MGARRDSAPILRGCVETDGPFPGHVAATELSQGPGACLAPNTDLGRRAIDYSLVCFGDRKQMCLEKGGVLWHMEATPTASLAINTLLETWRVGAGAGVHNGRLQSQGCLLV